ncbi:pyruvate dehydrogenase [Sediminihabitans luteus]|nr:pyruvate dehydrogenase [Sediminihabitans luteus]
MNTTNSTDKDQTRDGVPGEDRRGHEHSRQETYDVVVLGAGPVGENVADRASRTGLSVAIVEAELAGGECSYWACMPSKALLRPGAVAAAARDVPGVSAPSIDGAAVLAHRDEVVHDWDDSGQADWIESTGITLVRGFGRIVAPRTVEVEATAVSRVEDDASSASGDSASNGSPSNGSPSNGSPSNESSADGAPRTLVARRAVVVATGSVPRLPDVPGLLRAAPWGSREATSVETVPASLVVVGGGVVAVEMADAFAALGSHVTLLARSGLLGAMESFAGEQVAESLRGAGVDVVLGASPSRVDRTDGRVRVAYDGPDGGAVVEADEILVATGRVPRTTDLGLEAAGLPADALEDLPRGLGVDATGLVRGVDGDWLYASGDVLGSIATTHQGKYQARVCGDAIAARFGTDEREGVAAWGGSVPAAGTDPEPWTRYASTADGPAKTQVVFTRHQVAAVGLTAAQAREEGLDVRVVDVDLAGVAGGYLMGPSYGGTARIVVDEARHVIVGATFAGPEVAEMLHAATVAVVGEVPLERLWHAVPAYPTVSEAWLRLLEGYGL